VEDKGQSIELEIDVTFMDNRRSWLIGVVVNLGSSNQQEFPPPPQISHYRRRHNAVNSMAIAQNRTHTKTQQTPVKLPPVQTTICHSHMRRLRI